MLVCRQTCSNLESGRHRFSFLVSNGSAHGMSGAPSSALLWEGSAGYCGAIRLCLTNRGGWSSGPVHGWLVWWGSEPALVLGEQDGVSAGRLQRAQPCARSQLVPVLCAHWLKLGLLALRWQGMGWDLHVPEHTGSADNLCPLSEQRNRCSVKMIVPSFLPRSLSSGIQQGRPAVSQSAGDSLAVRGEGKAFVYLFTFI